MSSHVLTLTSPNSTNYGEFGYSVAASGKLVVVGASGENTAYLFNATTGALIHKFAHARSVATSSKLVIVGAPNEAVGGKLGAGDAYVFNATTGFFIRKLTSPNAQPSGAFGCSVAISGNLVAVGAFEETANGINGSGRAYVFNVATGALIQTFTSPNSQNDGKFGSSVAVSCKLLVVGAFYENNNAGHAYLFIATTGVLINALTSPDLQVSGFFGYSVTISSNLVGVGACDETAKGHNHAGHAYLFNATTGALIHKFTSPNLQDDGEFGYSLATSGKLMVAGAPGEAVSGNTSYGHVYIFNVTTGALIKTLTSPNLQSLEKFGYSVAISGNLVVAGAPFESFDGLTYAGRAYIF